MEGVSQGVDMFDCVLPTRVARNGALFTRTGRVNIANRRFAEQDAPLEEDCTCYACENFSAAYLWHLFKAKEVLGLRLASVHNLHFILRLMEGMRHAILEDRSSPSPGLPEPTAATGSHPPAEGKSASARGA